MKFFNYEPIVNAFLEIRILLHWEWYSFDKSEW